MKCDFIDSEKIYIKMTISEVILLVPSILIRISAQNREQYDTRYTIYVCNKYMYMDVCVYIYDSMTFHLQIRHTGLSHKVYNNYLPRAMTSFISTVPRLLLLRLYYLIYLDANSPLIRACISEQVSRVKRKSYITSFFSLPFLYGEKGGVAQIADNWTILINYAINQLDSLRDILIMTKRERYYFYILPVKSANVLRSIIIS